MDEKAQCRNCRKELIGKPYHLGGSAYDPITRERMPVSHYGGFVCSRRCDEEIIIEMHSSFPGAGICERVPYDMMRKLDKVWEDFQ